MGNPVLNEIVYSVLRSADKSELLKLRGKFLQAARSEKKAKFFVANSTFDEKASLLAEFGIRFFTWMVNDDSVTNKDLKRILDEACGMERGEALKLLSESEVYVISDKEYIHQLGLMASLSNHPSYKLSLEFNRAGYHCNRWTASVKNRHDRAVTEAFASADYISKVMLNASMIAERSSVLFDLPPLQIRILLYLYSVRHTHVNKEKIAAAFGGEISLTIASNNVTKLTEQFYVEKHLTEKPVAFTITSKGIAVVNRYMTAVINKSQ